MLEVKCKDKRGGDSSCLWKLVILTVVDRNSCARSHLAGRLETREFIANLLKHFGAKICPAKGIAVGSSAGTVSIAGAGAGAGAIADFDVVVVAL